MRKGTLLVPITILALIKIDLSHAALARKVDFLTIVIRAAALCVILANITTSSASTSKYDCAFFLNVSLHVHV